MKNLTTVTLAMMLASLALVALPGASAEAVDTAVAVGPCTDNPFDPCYWQCAPGWEGICEYVLPWGYATWEMACWLAGGIC